MLAPAGVDLSGSSGEAVVEGGTIQGIPVKLLRLAMHATGGDLKYDTKAPAAALGTAIQRIFAASSPLEGSGRSRFPWTALAVDSLVPSKLPRPSSVTPRRSRRRAATSG